MTSFKIICKTEPHYVHSSGYYGRHGYLRAQERIDSGDIYKYMYPADKVKEFIVVEE